ncbi:MAG: hypothetical protein AB1733_13000 [Thermodesulfobacteriota bacterium]
MVPCRCVKNHLFGRTMGLRLLVVSVVAVVFAASPALGLWMPWATEQDKVSKTLNDVWEALIRNDRAALKQYVMGLGSDLFIAREREIIERMKIREYECRPKSITIDPGNGAWAFADVEKIGKLENGDTFFRRDMSVLKKVNGLWRLVIEPKKSRRDKVDQKQKKEEASPGEFVESAERDSAPAGPVLNNVPVPSGSK